MSNLTKGRLLPTSGHGSSSKLFPHKTFFRRQMLPLANTFRGSKSTTFGRSDLTSVRRTLIEWVELHVRYYGIWCLPNQQPFFSLSMVRPVSGDGPLVSSLLSRMAKDVNLNGRNAVLQKDELLDVLSGVVAGQAFHVFLCKILTLFGDKDEINILANDSSVGLEKLLGLLAGCMSSALHSCNKDVVVPMVRQELSRLSW